MSDHGALSKEVELEAIEVLTSYLATNGTVHDMSDSQDYDFEIHYRDGRRAIGEIGLLANRDYESAWATLRSREKNHVVDLPPGFGTWGTHLYGNPNIKRFEKEIVGIIAELNERGIKEFQIGMHFELRALSQKCEAIGIQHLTKHLGYQIDQVVYFLDLGQTIFVDSTLDSLVKSIESAFLEGDFKDSWKKLIPFTSDEKHLFFKCGSLIPLNHQQVLLWAEPIPVIPEIYFPEGITHIWLLPNYVEAHGVLWSRDGEKLFVDRS